MYFPDRGCVRTLRTLYVYATDPFRYGTAVTAQRQLERQRRNGIFHVCNVILTALKEFLRHFRNGNGETATVERRTATEWWKVETRHKVSYNHRT